MASALVRELEEETGLKPATIRFLGVLDCRISHDGNTVAFVSHFFYLSGMKGKPSLPDSSENITAFKDVAIDDLPAVADNLRRVPAPRTGWGRWRAAGHEFLHELLNDRS